MVNRFRATTIAFGIATATILAGCGSVTPADSTYRSNDAKDVDEAES